MHPGRGCETLELYRCRFDPGNPKHASPLQLHTIPGLVFPALVKVNRCGDTLHRTNDSEPYLRLRVEVGQDQRDGSLNERSAEQIGGK